MIVNLDATLSALAEPTRRQVVELLGDSPRRAGELAASTKMSAPAMSRHLRVLRDSGLVEAQGVEEDARARVYRLRREAFADLQAWLEQVGAFWDEQLASFRKHVEKR